MIFMYANIPVNQQLFATTLFPDEPAINWFAHVLLLPYGEFGPEREIFATMRLSRTLRKFLAYEYKLVCCMRKGKFMAQWSSVFGQ